MWMLGHYTWAAFGHTIVIQVLVLGYSFVGKRYDDDGGRDRASPYNDHMGLRCHRRSSLGEIVNQPLAIQLKHLIR